QLRRRQDGGHWLFRAVCLSLGCSCKNPGDPPRGGSPARTIRELIAHAVPELRRPLGTVRDLFRRGEAPSQWAPSASFAAFSGCAMVGATGIEPVTPTMSR